jgi:hypothetical protein
MADTSSLDEMNATIERALGLVSVGQLAVDEARQVIARAVVRAHLESTPAQQDAQRAAMYLAKFDELGADRWAASKVGKYYGRDPLEVERIAQHVRKLDRDRKTKTLRMAG